MYYISQHMYESKNKLSYSNKLIKYLYSMDSHRINIMSFTLTFRTFDVNLNIMLYLLMHD